MIDYIEIREHLKIAEGSADSVPSINDIVKAIREEGYIGFNVETDYDNLMKMWRFTSDIKPITD